VTIDACHVFFMTDPQLTRVTLGIEQVRPIFAIETIIFTIPTPVINIPGGNALVLFSAVLT
jgi:hypothetical protein